MHFANNIKLLRKRSGFSQEDLAEQLNLTRSTLSGYENDTAEPSFNVLVKFAEFYSIKIDNLLRTDLGKLGEHRLSEMERGLDVDIEGKKLRVLATTVNQEDKENIEMVNEKAKAGYAQGFEDPEYLRVLPAFRLPFLSSQRKYRSFQIKGDSMPPVVEGAWVTGEFVQNWELVRSGQPYVVVTRNDGIVFKIAYNKIEESQGFLLCSTNPEYEPFEVHVNDILEIWKFVNYISSELPEPNLDRDDLNSAVMNLQKQVTEIKNVIDTNLIK